MKSNAYSEKGNKMITLILIYLAIGFLITLLMELHNPYILLNDDPVRILVILAWPILLALLHVVIAFKLPMMLYRFLLDKLEDLKDLEEEKLWKK